MTKEELEKLTPAELAERLLAAEQENAELVEGRTAAEGRAQTYSQQLADVAAQRARDAEAARVAGNAAWLVTVAEGATPRMLPAEREYAAHLLDVLTAPAGTQVKAYAEKATVKVDGKDVEQVTELAPADVLRRLFERRAPGGIAKLFADQTESRGTVDAEAVAPELKTPEDAKAEVVRLAKEHVAKHGGDLASAYAKVYADRPELKALAANVRPEGASAAEEGARHFSQIAASR